MGDILLLLVDDGVIGAGELVIGMGAGADGRLIPSCCDVGGLVMVKSSGKNWNKLRDELIWNC